MKIKAYGKDVATTDEQIIHVELPVRVWISGVVAFITVISAVTWAYWRLDSQSHFLAEARLEDRQTTARLAESLDKLASSVAKLEGRLDGIPYSKGK